jgi:uncharacterized membrane protein YphA (DoxX/SURF4 family)
MKNPLASDLSGNLGLLLARVPLGLFFALAGYAHFKTHGFATLHVGNLPDWMPSEAGRGYSSVLPFLEMAVGALLVLGLTTRVGGALAAAITGMVIAGAGFRIYPDTGHQTLITLGLAILLLCMGGGKFTLDNFLFNNKKPQHEAHA